MGARITILRSSVGSQLRAVVDGALRQSHLLENTARTAGAALDDVNVTATSRELLRAASALRGVVGHALSTIAELQSCAGHIEALAGLSAHEDPASR